MATAMEHKREFLKDVSSFANSFGGDLVIGMKETGGVASRIAPLSDDADEARLRLENLARDSINPRIAGLRMTNVTVEGGFVIVIRVPRSFNPPHRVTFKNSNRIWGRNSAGAYELSVEELRVIFTSGASAIDRLRAFRAERSTLIEANQGAVPIVRESGHLILHLLPFAAFSSMPAIDLQRASEVGDQFRPMNNEGYGKRFTFDGLLMRSGTTPAMAYTQLYRNGVIEAVSTYVMGPYQGRNIFPADEIVNRTITGLNRYMDGLRQLEVTPPFAALVTLQGTMGAYIWLKPRAQYFDADPPVLTRSQLEFPELMIEDFSDDYSLTLRPVFDALWNAAGEIRCSFYDDEGRWIGQGRT